MLLNLKISILMVILMACYTQAGVLRSEDLAESTTPALETSTSFADQVLATTPKDLVKNIPIAIALTRDEDASIKIVEQSTVEPKDELQGTTPKDLVKNVPIAIALTRDEDASIQIVEEETSVDSALSSTTVPVDHVQVTTPKDLLKNVPIAIALTRDEDDDSIALVEVASVDPALGTVEDTEVLILAIQDADTAPAAKLEKSAKLLLLSAPKNIEKPKEPEENIEEPEDIDDAGAETTTAQLIETTTTAEISDADDADTIDPSKLVTKLFAINDTLSADYPKRISSEESVKSEDSKTTEETKDSTVVVPDEQASESKADNFGTTLLIETEADYVLVDADVEEFGSFTHENSAVHLQPIVQSVEIVPTHVNDPFFVNYVHHEW